jgi:plastocyanin
MSLQYRRRSFGAFLVLPLLGLLACGNATGYSSGGSGFPTPTGADIIMVHNAMNRTTTAFSPNPFSVALNGGASVAVNFGNDDAITHNITDDSGNHLFNHNLTSGSTFIVNFTTAGDYNFHCAIHPNMVGTIHVTP